MNKRKKLLKKIERAKSRHLDPHEYKRLANSLAHTLENILYWSK